MTKYLYQICASALLLALVAMPVSVQAQATEAPPSSCVNLLLNGSMEDETGWAFDPRSSNGEYVGNGRSGRGILLSIEPELSGARPRWSSVIQRVELPLGSPATLSLWYQFQHSADVQVTEQITVLDAEGSPLTVLLTQMAPTAGWKRLTADLSVYAGSSIQIFASISADDPASGASLLLDDVVLCDPNSVAPAPEISEATASSDDEDQPASTAEAAVEEEEEPGEDQAALAEEALEPVLPSPPPAIDADTIIGFDQLQAQDLTLISPLGAAQMEFRLPASWDMEAGSSLQLDLQTSLVDTLNELDFTDTGGAALMVELNGVELAQIPIEQLGRSQATVIIPDTAFAAVSPTEIQQLRFAINTGAQCLPRRRITVDIQPTSLIRLAYQQAAVSTSLAALPYPIIQNSFLPDTATIVVADQPSAEEIQAALNTAASLGQMSNGDLSLSFASAGKLTDEARSADHLIFVGTAAQLAPIGELQSGTPAALGAGEGVIYMINSPWNESKVAMIISGADSAGVVKASQAFSSGSLQPSGAENTTIVSNINTDVRLNRGEVDRTFVALGYSAKIAEGSGLQTLRYQFNMPVGEVVNDGAYLNLIFNHSTALDYRASSAVVELNGQPISNLIMSDTSSQFFTLRIPVPSSSIRFGQNDLTVTTQLRPRENCATAANSDIWLTVWPESLLHLPIDPVQDTITSSPRLDDYPGPFSLHPSLATTAFVVPENDPDSWDVAAQIAFDLGRQVQGSLINLHVAYGILADEQVRQARSIIVVGRPSDLPMITELDQGLPASFTPDNMLARQYETLVSYRFADDADIGYLETTTSPWNPTQVVLGVLGNTATGVRQAGQALIDVALRQQVTGNLSVINGGQVVANAMQNSVQQQATVDTLDSVMTTPEFTRPAWIIPTIAGSLVLIIAIFGFVVFTAVRQRRPSR